MSSPPLEGPIALKRLAPAALDAWLAARIAPAWRLRAVKQWIYAKGALEWEAMTDLPRTLRAALAAEASLCSVTPVLATRSAVDGSVKHLLRMADGETVEAVHMAGERHPTFCISSQVGCPLDCVFCETGRMGFRRNLEQDEILDQVLLLQRDLPADSVRPNLVFMGMGEPLLNFGPLVGALRVLGDGDGLGYGGRRITVSTAGLPGRIADLASAPVKVGLALSLNAADDATRAALMPALHKHRIATLLAACEDYARRTERRVTLEYVLLAGVNDRDEDAANLRALTRRRPFKLNIIPYNPGAALVRIALPGAGGQAALARPTPEQVERFVGRLVPAVPAVTVRWSQGVDVGGGCGQLRGMHRESAGS
jgi:23S rRNA (adenine2503-C2)-methyltransferase